jgi:hypothetical protein
MTTPLQLVGDDPTVEMTVAEAAARYGISSTAIRRRLKEKPRADGRRRATALPNAHRDETGAWMIPVDDLETAQFKAGTQADTFEGTHLEAPEPPIAADSLRDELAAARQRIAVAEQMTTEARRELVERLADKDQIIRAIRETVETQSATIAALAREVEDKGDRLALMEERAEALDTAPPDRYTDATGWEASSVATDPDESDPVPVGELRRRLADQQPPPRRWWQPRRRA